MTWKGVRAIRKLSREIKSTFKLILIWYTGCRYYLLHGCYVHLDQYTYSHRWPDGGILWYPGVSDVWQLGQYRRSPRHWLSLVSCHFFLSSISATAIPRRFSLQFAVRRLFLLFQIQIREIARQTVTLRLENWRTRNPADHSGIDLKYLMRNSGCRRKNDHVALTCARELIRTRIGLRGGGGEGRGRWKSIMYLIVESLPGLDLQ